VSTATKRPRRGRRPWSRHRSGAPARELPPRLRVAFVIGTLHIGGSELQMARLATEFVAAGHEVTVFALHAGGPVAEILDAAAVPWRGPFGIGTRWASGKPFWRQPKSLFTYQVPRMLSFARALRRYRPDVCIGYLYWGYVLATPVAAALGVPVRITTRRGMAEGLTSQTFRRMPRFINALTDVVVANSEMVGAEAIAIEGLPEAKLRVIHNGVDLPESSTDVAAEPPTALMIANLIAYKGHEDVIAALALLDDPPSVRFVGDGRERARLESLVNEAHLGGRVVFEGSVPQAAGLFRSAQFGILASHEESLPNTVLEAMAAGVPMVATAVGGVPELIDDEVSGLLVPPGDPESLAGAIKRLAADPALRVRLGAAARQRAEQFSWPACVRAHLDVISEVAHRV
jgi:glycosyltransferase involved in cell wall biosynthesis